MAPPHKPSFFTTCRTDSEVLFTAVMKVREVIALLKEDGWQPVNARGGHRQYKNASKKGRVTVSGHPGDDVHPKTLSSILKQAGLK